MVIVNTVFLLTIHKNVFASNPDPFQIRARKYFGLESNGSIPTADLSFLRALNATQVGHRSGDKAVENARVTYSYS